MTDTYELNEFRLGKKVNWDRKWVWPKRIPAAKTTIISGKSGVGKTHFIASVISHIINQTEFPDGELSDIEPGDIYIVTTESDQDVLEETFEAQNLNEQQRDHIHVVVGIRNTTDNNELPFVFQDCLPILRAAIKKNKPIGFILDPLMEFSRLRKDNDAKSVRESLLPLEKFCRDENVFILAVAHWNKDDRQSRESRLAGSMQFLATVRAAISLERANEAGRVNVHQDKPFGEMPSDLDFQIVKPDGHIEWLKADKNEAKLKVVQAQEWMLRVLDGRWLTPRTCVELSHFNRKTLDRARKALANEIKTGFVYVPGVDGHAVACWTVNHGEETVISMAEPSFDDIINDEDIEVI